MSVKHSGTRESIRNPFQFLPYFRQIHSCTDLNDLMLIMIYYAIQFLV
mgnify:FL=1